jgi:hypothetical protein
VEGGPIAPDPQKGDASQAQIDEWSRERIRKEVKACEFGQAQKVGEKKMGGNPVFHKYEGCNVRGQKGDCSIPTSERASCLFESEALSRNLACCHVSNWVARRGWR